MDTTRYLAFVATAVVIILIPGPSLLFVLGRSLSLGRRGGLLSAAGNAVGQIPAITAVALGLGAILSASVLAFTVIKFAGAAYLIYLGVQAIRHRRVTESSEQAAPRSAWALLREGFLVGITNPKTAVFYVAVLPQFVDPAGAEIPLQLAVLGATFIAIAVCLDSMWVLLASVLRGWFARSPKRLERMRGIGGGMLVALGGVLLIPVEKT
jgi:threonine/homoserine/homoserine lactone efflux protein